MTLEHRGIADVSRTVQGAEASLRKRAPSPFFFFAIYSVSAKAQNPIPEARATYCLPSTM